MTYLEKKLNKKTSRFSSTLLFNRILIRVVIVGLLVVGAVRGWSCAVEAIRNAPVSEYDLNHYRNARMRALLDLRIKGRVTPEQFTKQVQYMANDSNATREYIQDER